MPLVEMPHKYTITHFSKPSFIREEYEPNIPHDLLFKQLIQMYFEEFIEVFFPKFHAKIDFNSVNFLSEEVIPDSFAADKRVLDIVVEVKWKSTDTIIIIHVEPQSYKQANFNERMFHYFSILYNKLRKPIIPIAVFSFDEPPNIDHFEMNLDNVNILRFNYFPIHLRSMNWRHFIRKENPISAALMSKMGYNESEKVQVKLEFARIMQTLKIDQEKQAFLFRFFDVYLKLTREEEDELMAEIKKDQESFDISSLPISFVEWGKEVGREEGRVEGREKGREEGRKEGRKEGREAEQERVALKMLQENISLEVIMKVTELDEEQLEKLKEKL